MLGPSSKLTSSKADSMRVSAHSVRHSTTLRIVVVVGQLDHPTSPPTREMGETDPAAMNNTLDSGDTGFDDMFMADNAGCDAGATFDAPSFEASEPVE